MGRWNKMDVSNWIGRRFGKLVVADITQTKDQKTACVCYCDCDPKHLNPITVRAYDLKRGFKLSCGCKKHDYHSYRGSVKVGNKYTRLTVLEIYDDPTKMQGRRHLCKCRCDCGNIVDVKCDSLNSGNVKSCGCLDRERLRPIHPGDRFGKLVVIEKMKQRSKDNRQRYLCRCDCGNVKAVVAHCLNSGDTKSCGCLVHQLRDVYQGRVKVGDVYGNLTVVEILKEHKAGKVRKVVCKCACGKNDHFVTTSNNLLSGSTKSCGCLYRVLGTPEKVALDNKLRGMIKRCYDPKCAGYEHWGGKGVTICSEWLDPETGRDAFFEWAFKTGYKLGDTIDRINAGKYHKLQDGPYAPWNCRWATMKEQQNNRSTNHELTIRSETKNVTQWAEYLGIPPSRIFSRLGRMSEEKVCRHIESLLNTMITIDGVTKSFPYWEEKYHTPPGFCYRMYKKYNGNLLGVIDELKYWKQTRETPF